MSDAGLPVVLAVDDDVDNLHLYERILRQDFTVRTAKDGPSAIAVAAEEPLPSVIVTDQRMPGMTGVELLTRLIHLADVPKIIVTAYSDIEPVLLAINTCALFGYVLKPLEPRHFLEMVRRACSEHTSLRLLREVTTRISADNHELRHSNERLMHATQQLRQANSQLSTSLEGVRKAYTQMASLAHRDPLTALHNRRAFIAALAEEFERCRRYGRTATLLALDVDGLKGINDELGHPAGDRALSLVGKALGGGLRANDSAYRVGGDEFAILLPESQETAAAHVLDKIRTALRAPPAPPLRNPVQVSAGWHVFAEDCSSSDHWYALADAALYRDKAEKRKQSGNR